MFNNCMVSDFGLARNKMFVILASDVLNKAIILYDVRFLGNNNATDLSISSIFSVT